MLTALREAEPHHHAWPKQLDQKGKIAPPMAAPADSVRYPSALHVASSPPGRPEDAPPLRARSDARENGRLPVQRLWVSAAVLLYCIGAFVVIWSRRPDALTRPQFFAEDGAIWFRAAYNTGPLAPLILTQNGYFQTLPRLVADLSLPFGLANAPLFYNIIAIALQAAPGLLLLSRRFAHLIPSLYIRALIGFIYILVPNAEIHANVTNAMSHLAILAAMLLVAAPPKGWSGKATDLVVIGLSGISGPFIVFLIPLAAARWWRSRAPWSRTMLGISAALGMVQLCSILLNAGAGRSSAPLGASPGIFAKILVNRVIVPAFSGQDALPYIFVQEWPHRLVLTSLVLIAATSLLTWAIWRGPSELRFLLLFAALVLMAALATPQVDLVRPQWPVLANSGGSDRYFLIPVLGVMLAAIWAVGRLPRRLALPVATVLCAVFVVGDITHWQYHPFADVGFGRDVQILNAAPSGSIVTLPIYPPGWQMVLRKH